MNEITRAAVRSASKERPSVAKKATSGEEHWKRQFHYFVLEEHNNLIFARISWKLRQRAERLFYLRRPDFFDEEGYLNDDYFDYTCFVPTVERIINRHIDNHPELQLDNYDSYLAELFPQQLELFNP